MTVKDTLPIAASAIVAGVALWFVAPYAFMWLMGYLIEWTIYNSAGLPFLAP